MQSNKRGWQVTGRRRGGVVVVVLRCDSIMSSDEQ
jgi:hypothetical protein